MESEFFNLQGCMGACVSGRNINVPCSLVAFQISMVIHICIAPNLLTNG